MGGALQAQDLPEGVIQEVSLDEFLAIQGTPDIRNVFSIPNSDSNGQDNQASPGMFGPSLFGAGIGTSLSPNSYLMSYGFQAADDFAIGMVAYPNILSVRGFAAGPIPQSPIAFGHTIPYVRIDGRIVSMASYAPESLLAAGVDAYLPRTYGGQSGVPAQIINHLDPPPGVLSLPGTHGFPSTNATSIEWPVTAEQARLMASRLTNSEIPNGASYAAYVEKVCAKRGQNCVSWALDLLESSPEQGGLGGPIGQVGEPSIRNQSGLNTSRQGRVQGLMEGAPPVGNKPIANLPGTTGEPVIRQMPTRFRVIKWGGRLFMVAGIAYSGYRVATAAPEERARIISQEAGGFIGGFALGATAGLVCGPGAPVCSLVAGVTLGIVGGVGGSYFGGEIYDIAVNATERISEILEGTNESFLAIPHPYAFPMWFIDMDEHDPEGARMVREAYQSDEGAIRFWRALSGLSY